MVAPGRVAVVTGAASGIGLGLSERFAAEGMSVVMADVEAPALHEAAGKLSGQGATVLPVVTDVSSAQQVEALRDEAVSAFGAVHVLCNNAGVGGPTGALWLVPEGDWEWVLGAGEAERASAERFRQLARTGREPSEVARIAVDAIRAGRFYILTSTNRNEAVRRRAEEILAGDPPAPPLP